MRHVLDAIPFQLGATLLMRQLHIKESSPYAGTFRDILDEAASLARPKALYRVAYVEEKGNDFVVIEGVRFDSRVLRINLEIAQRVFVYVATCGVEIDAWSRLLDDMLYQFWADAIKQAALSAATQTLARHLEDTHRLGRTATMVPGALEDWPLQQQRPLFSLLGDVQADIGVHLSESLSMSPNKTVSGIRFPTEEHFESCLLCPRESCPGRRAPYDRTLYERKYA